MQKSLLVVCAIIIVIASACKKTSERYSNAVVGKWKLTETLVSPGPMGEWEPVSQGNSSSVHFLPGGGSTGTGVLPGYDRYSITNDSTRIIFIKSASQDSTSMGYTITSNLLTVYLPCIEPCGLRFVPVK